MIINCSITPLTVLQYPRAVVLCLSRQENVLLVFSFSHFSSTVHYIEISRIWAKLGKDFVSIISKYIFFGEYFVSISIRDYRTVTATCKIV